MNLSFYHLDAFTSHVFEGNPACVCILHEALPKEIMQGIANENNLPATAFVVTGKPVFDIRWFSPHEELSLCGHGTLAAAAVIFHKLDYIKSSIIFNSIHSGSLTATRESDIINLDFPSRSLISYSEHEHLLQDLGVSSVKEAFCYDADRLLIILDDEHGVRELTPNFNRLKNLEFRGIIVSAESTRVDFVSRTFYPRKIVKEDPVTGSSHCLLVPYWAKKLNKSELHALQLSERGGEIFCQYKEGRTIIGGRVAFFAEGSLQI